MAQESVSISKITCPDVKNVVLRQRLHRYLADEERRPVTWVTGPPGCGKTTLIAAHKKEYQTPCLWYEIDERDDDPASFFYHLGMAARAASPRETDPLPPLTPEYLQSLPIFTKNYFEQLFGNLPAGNVVVFDNFQDASQRSFHDIMQNGLSRIPRGIRVVIVSRKDPPSSFARLLANGAIDLMGWDDLRLTLAESIEIAKVRLRKKPGRLFEKTIRSFHDQTKGWVAGLVLMLEHSKLAKLTPDMLPAESHDLIFNYFAEEIIRKANEALRLFLMKTAFLPGMSAHMAEALTGNGNAAAILDDFNKNNDFTFKFFRPSGVYYQYHDLFREFLVERAQKEWSPGEFAANQQSAAIILKQQGMLDEAAQLFIECRDWGSLIPIILENAPQMAQEGKNETLHGWIQAIPDAILKETPWLIYWKGISGITINPQESLKDLKTAFEIFRKDQEIAGIFMAWCGIVDLFSLVFEARYTEMSPWISMFDRLKREYPVYPSKAVELQVCASRLHGLLYCMMWHPDIPKYGERGLFLSRETHNIGLRMKIAADMATYYIWMGEMAKARSMLDILEKFTGSDAAPPIFRIGGKLIAVVYDWLNTHHDKCLSNVKQLLNIAQQTGLHGADYFVLGHGAANLLSQGDLEGARGYLDKMVPLARQAKPHVSSFYYGLAGWEAYLEKDYPRAVQLFETGLEVSAFYRVISLSMRLSLYFGLAHSYFEYGAKKIAADQLVHLFEIARESKSRLFELAYLITKARFILAKGAKELNETIGENQAHESGLDALKKGMAASREIGLVNFLPWLPPVWAELCVKALENGIETAYVKDLIKRRNLLPDPFPVHLKEWPVPFRIYTFGRFLVRQNGTPISHSRKLPRKPLEILKLLAAHGGDVHEDRLSDCLWPDAEGDMAYKALKINLHRLRKILGNNEAIVHREGSIQLDPRYFWIDTLALERLFELWKEEADDPDKTIDETENLTTMVFDLYKGAFLRDDRETSWAIAFRERFRNKFLRFIEGIGLSCENKGAWTKAMDCYLKGLEADDTAEVFYCRLMSCYQNLGRNAEALRVYGRCKQILLSAFGVEPSPETEAVYRTLTTISHDPEAERTNDRDQSV